VNIYSLRSRRVITPDGMKAATVTIVDGKIISVLDYQTDPACPVKDLGSSVLMPGIVDTHVHINEPGRTDWEGFNTATQAAAAGGITTLVDMPLNCSPVTTTKSALEKKLSAVQGKLWVDCGFWGGVVPDSIDSLDELLNSGVLGVKSFLIHSGIDEFPNVSEHDLRRAMPILAKHDVPYLIHAELDKVQLTPPAIGDNYQSFLASRPKQWENDAIDLMIQLCREAKSKGLDCRVHIVHLSSADALHNISLARSEGLSLTTETCPHYLTFFSETIPNGKTLFKCCPPIREKHNRELLWQAIKDGVIDFIVSDHSPCTPELKHIDSGDIEKAWGGISALQFGLPLIWTEAQKRGFTLMDISQLMSSATADFSGIGHIKGRISPGYDADLLVFDDSDTYPICTDAIKHRHKITPYNGKTVTGKVISTYVRGELVYHDNSFVTGPIGQPILRSTHS